MSNRSSKQSPTSNDNHAKDDRLITKSTVTRSSKTRNGRNILPSSSKSDALLPNKDTVEQVITSLQEEQVPTSKSNVSVLPNLCTKTSKKNEMSNHHVALTSSSGLRGRKTNRSRNLFIESPISSTQAKRRKCDFGYNITFGEMENANISVFERSSFVTRSRTRAESSKSTPSVARSAFNSRKSLKHNIPASEDSSDDVVLIKRDRHREKSPTPPILVVAVNTTSSFVPVKRDNCRHADVITLPTCNKGEARFIRRTVQKY
ncbi:hypothetical protein DICVIV_13291 [Dictyocaulus viviparus]|uniref:Uncharacterized protein n=1 Tax=Dictyocaulus viviparus TaxID=29172 RepID=A0A0D8X861_DICVI|nr:hypothetical protein DICVIV_13291 [Dictyocaulus viviparus]